LIIIYNLEYREGRGIL